jgi:hypothetical protein
MTAHGTGDLCLESKQVNGSQCGKPSHALNREHRESAERLPRQPLDGEKSYDRYLRSHEELPDMGSSAFISLAGDPKDSDMNSHGDKRGQGHHWWKKGAGAFQQSLHMNS